MHTAPCPHTSPTDAYRYILQAMRMVMHFDPLVAQMRREILGNVATIAPTVVGGDTDADSLGRKTGAPGHTGTRRVELEAEWCETTFRTGHVGSACETLICSRACWAKSIGRSNFGCSTR